MKSEEDQGAQASKRGSQGSVEIDEWEPDKKAGGETEKNRKTGLYPGTPIG